MLEIPLSLSKIYSNSRESPDLSFSDLPDPFGTYLREIDPKEFNPKYDPAAVDAVPAAKKDKKKKAGGEDPPPPGEDTPAT